jgi:hypothetical protein
MTAPREIASDGQAGREEIYATLCPENISPLICTIGERNETNGSTSLVSVSLSVSLLSVSPELIMKLFITSCIEASFFTHRNFLYLLRSGSNPHTARRS